MKLINRGFLLAKPKTAFIEWATQIDPELMMDEDSEGSLYLIEEEFWDDDLIIEKYAKKIWAQECSNIEEDPKNWPALSETQTFTHFFHTELGCTVIDLLKEPLEQEEL
jgi:hypothetical protein